MKRFLQDDRLTRFIYDLIRVGRERLFSRDFDPEAIDLVADIDADSAAIILARAGFTSNWILSFNYHGEDANMANFWYDDDRFPVYPFRQTHVRLFDEETPDGYVGIGVHTEPNALAHREKHLDMDQIDRNEGADIIRNVFDDYDVEVMAND